MIGIRLVGVQVRDLGEGQHGQKDKAQPRNRGHRCAARAEIHVQMCPKSCQNPSPTPSGYTMLDAQLQAPVTF
jgi:hypothetical protein